VSINKAVAVVLAFAISVALAFAENSNEQVFRDLENRISHAVMTKDANWLIAIRARRCALREQLGHALAR
jgi:hypothetical protein